MEITITENKSNYTWTCDSKGKIEKVYRIKDEFASSPEFDHDNSEIIDWTSEEPNPRHFEMVASKREKRGDKKIKQIGVFKNKIYAII